MTATAHLAARPLVIVGPTASGKSDLALEVARAVGRAEIVTLDSMQVYRGMDVGTATPAAHERAEVPHHLVDVVDPCEEFTVAEQQRLVRAALGEIRDRQAVPVLVGGTGLYVRAVVDGLSIPGRYPQVRSVLEAEPDTGALHRRLAALDPVAAGRMEPTNRRRVLRALEVTLGSGEPFSSFGPGLGHYPPTPFVQVGLRWERACLDERIAARYRRQMAAGLLEEVRRLQRRALSRSASQALGYKELLAHLRGDTGLQEALDLAVARTRRFARRQERWFRRDGRIRWLDAPVAAAEVLSVWKAAAGSAGKFERSHASRGADASTRSGVSGFGAASVPERMLSVSAGLRLHKLHGLGNDFLVMLAERLPSEADGSRAASALCHRRRGIGADGLIFAVLDPGGEGAVGGAAMRLWNSDGSPAEVSGNGLRCLAHAIALSRGADSLDIVIDTLAGPRECSIRPQPGAGGHAGGGVAAGTLSVSGAVDTSGTNAATGAAAVPGTGTGADDFGGSRRVVGTVEMGEPEVGPLPEVPTADVVEAVRGHIGPGGVERWQTVRVGNPHVVLAVADPAAVALHKAGPAVESLFSGGINVHFAAATGVDEITMSVWERGAGVTEACGSGAVAAAAAFRAWGAVGQDVAVRMVGGEARVDLSAPPTLTGESAYVASITVGDG